MLREVRVGQLRVICVSSVTTVCVFGSCDLSTKGYFTADGVAIINSFDFKYVSFVVYVNAWSLLMFKIYVCIYGDFL